jgi:DNA-binding NtrC family response regulator
MSILLTSSAESYLPGTNKLLKFDFLKYPLTQGDVLIVEDDNSTLQLMKKAVQEAYEVVRVVSFTTADDAIWFLEYLKRNYQPGPALAIVDIFLKGKKDGFSVCNLIAKDFPETKIVVASSMHPEAFAEKSDGISPKPSFFSKPFTIRELVNLFRRFKSSSKEV